MTVYLCPEFIRDLCNHGDANFAGRVLSKAFNAKGEFEADTDDHRYKGIEDGWIRYVSTGNTAYRAIFVRKGKDIFWYRAGSHAVENRLSAPKTLADAVAISAPPAIGDVDADFRNARYSKSTHPKYLHQLLAARRLIPHRNISFASPRIDVALFAPHGLVGQLIQSAIEMGGTFTLITRPPAARDLNQYRWIADRGVDLLLHEHLNARLYYFEVNPDKLDKELQHIESLAVIGSSELTASALNFPPGAQVDEELCYEIEKDDLDGTLEFFLHLVDAAPDLTTYVATQALR